MPDFEFDVDASIAAGWERFAARLADFLRDLVSGATFDLTMPDPGTSPGFRPQIRFYASAAYEGDVAHPPARPSMLTAKICGGERDDEPPPLRANQYDQLASLGWELNRSGTEIIHPRMRVPADQAHHLAHLIAGTVERVFGVPHPVFLQDETEHHPTRIQQYKSNEVDFRSQPIADPDQATKAIAVALSEVYGVHVEADEHDVYTVPAGCVVLFVRAHRSLPLIVFRSLLISQVEDLAAAEVEVAILNRDSLWCRYVFDGKVVYAESELVDRVFVPVNFKIQLAEIAAELDDIYPDLARRVAAEQWRDLHSADDPTSNEQ